MNNTLFNGSIPNQYNDNKTKNLSGNQFNTIKKHIPFSSDIRLPLVFLGVLSCLIITANLLVIVLVYRNKQLRTTTNLYLACLALSDLLSGLIAIPLIFACNLMALGGNIAACIAMDLASRFITLCTILLLVIVTFALYVMIIHPLQYRKIISKQTTVASLILIWIFSLSMSLIQLFWISLDSTQTLKHERRIDAIYSFCCFVFLVVLLVILLAIASVRIFPVLRSQLKKIRRQLSHITRVGRVSQKRGQKRAVIIFGSMIVAFILGWFSYFLSGIFFDENVAIHVPPIVNTILLFLRFGTSLINPLLYTLFKEDFKTVAKRER